MSSLRDPERLALFVLVLATATLNPAAVDPTCWASGLSYRQCCGSADASGGRSGGDTSCWDDLYPEERCCVDQYSLTEEAPLEALALSQSYLDLELEAAARCWPGRGARVFRDCCDLRRGLKGDATCFAAGGPAASFEDCCLPTLLSGLDPCEAEWCMPERWSPFPIIGLTGGVLDHRAYVGMEKGRGWYEVGEAEFEFLRHPEGGGMTPSGHVLEIACGSFRLGRHLIPWLEPGHYKGLDKSRRLIEQGYLFELGRRDREEKHPRFAATAEFEFELLRGGPPPDMSIAVSLITHLNPPDIRKLLSRLRIFVAKGHMFFPTFVHSSSDADNDNPEGSSSIATFRYKFDELRSLTADLGGWELADVSPVWHATLRKFAARHPRALRHRMLRFTAV
mmetsp:Transcript_89353/g.288937  ORF Transcript_89353/g.288937 Transcript_89353/m.288937 type:complete len:394 (-) Transcript_89353:55-1236(-)|eukprot:CAMPEP_0204114766 /NCGR_PEP_ID=MMETSP0361-20130328/4451_1 /ASSEMBLY_ACC=CAM_ASM_000343 /TAXON_ID=268821 /ORGANISM="Scrippsiella Hangoei, Strain SHTV-5" /LENGTH=393 /DNA_ID=CAMNT_0051065355 /DNA_START=39 /DNA_END=1223 /DNA_ORIENTATION=-